MPTHFIKRGGVWVLGQGVLMLAVIVLGVVCRSGPLKPGALIAGAILFVVGAVCGIAGAIALGANLTPFPRPAPATQLVQHGIYSLVRHPLYTSVTCCSLGWALLWQSWPALAAALALAVFFDAKARREERWLRGQFPGYAEYQQRVRRFIPWLY